MKRLFVLLCTLAVVALAFAAAASAGQIAPGGAWNMLHDASMVSGPMQHDSTQNTNGNAGMCRAVLVSSGVAAPSPPCP